MPSAELGDLRMLDTPENLELGARIAQAMLGAMASDAWNTFKAPFLRIWKNHDAAAADKAESKLEADRAQVVGNNGQVAGEMVDRITARWTTRIEDLLDEFPQAATPLEDLLKKSAGEGHAATSVRIEAKADRHSRNYISGTGDVNVTGS